MRTILHVETIGGFPILDHQMFHLSSFHRTIVVPEPYQAGDAADWGEAPDWTGNHADDFIRSHDLW